MFEELIKKMTLEEKCCMVTGAGSMNTCPVDHLGVPLKMLADGPQGVRNPAVGDNCVCFPCMSAVATSWDVDAAEKTGEALAEDCVRHGVDMILGPGANIKRNPLCGRNFEYLSEDPVLTGKMAAKVIEGCEKRGVATSLKHYAANSQETNRTTINAEIDERTLREIYLRGFEIAVKEGKPQSVMCAYNKVNAVWCSENNLLLNEILKDEWSYEGFVVSDWGAVHDECKVLMAGLDLQMPSNPSIVEKLKAGLANGTVTEEALDHAVERILRFSMRPAPKKSSVSREELHATAQKLAADGIVLMQNQGNILPLDPKKTKKIAVVGELAKRPLMIGQGSGEVFPDESMVDSPLECLKKALPNTQIDYIEAQMNGFQVGNLSWQVYRERFANVKDYEAVIVFLGFQKTYESEKYDRPSGRLTPFVEQILNDLVLRTEKTVAVFQTGSAVFPADWVKKTAAFLQMGLSGEGGGQAIADVLTGKVNPSGKLAETYPKTLRTDMDQFGDSIVLDYGEKLGVGYRYYDRHPEQVWFPFGHGLSYTQFAYSSIDVKEAKDGVDVSFKLKNVGSVAGAEVAQIYVKDTVSTVSKPEKELRAFRKIFLKPGEEKKVTVNLSARDFCYYNVILHDWIAETGKYEILVGSSTADIRLNASYYLDNKNCYTITKQHDDMIG